MNTCYHLKILRMDPWDSDSEEYYDPDGAVLKRLIYGRCLCVICTIVVTIIMIALIFVMVYSGMQT